MKKTLKEVNLRDLKPHPKNHELYGRTQPGHFDQNLIASLQRNVAEGELYITTGNVIISGHRRIEHCLEGGIETAVVWVRDDLPEDPDSPEVIRELLDQNLQRSKEKFVLALELKLRNEANKRLMRQEQIKDRPRDEHGNLVAGANTTKAVEPSKSKTPMIVKSAKQMGLEGSASVLRENVQAAAAIQEAYNSGDEEKIRSADKARLTLNTKSGKAAVAIAKELGLIESQPKNAKPKAEPKPLVLKGGEKLKAWWCHPDIPKAQLKNIEKVMRSDIDYEDQELRPSPVAAKWILDNREQLQKQQELLIQMKALDLMMIEMRDKLVPMCEKLGRGPLHDHMRKVELHLKDSPVIDACPGGYEALLRSIKLQSEQLTERAHQMLYQCGWEENASE